MAKKGGKKSDVISEEMWETIEEKILEKLYFTQYSSFEILK